MGFRIRKINKAGKNAIIETINEDYHNGDCAFLLPSAEMEPLSASLKYLVVDYVDHLVLIYPELH